MAERYYSLKETAEKLGKTEEEVKGLVESGKLKAMGQEPELFFKAGEVDKLAELISESPAEVALGGSGDTTKVSLEEGTGTPELQLEGTGSGSGLLDLKLQHDDTSLGADILGEILDQEAGPAETPTGEEPPVLGAPGGTTGILEEAEALEEKAPAITPTPLVVARKITAEAHPISNVIILSTGLIAVIYGLIIAAAARRGVTPGLLTRTKDIYWWLLIGAVCVVVFGNTLPRWVFPQIGAYLQARAGQKKVSPRVKKVKKKEKKI